MYVYVYVYIYIYRLIQGTVKIRVHSVQHIWKPKIQSSLMDN